MKRTLVFLLCFAILLGSAPAFAEEPLRDGDITISAPSAVLMEKETGTLLYEKDAHKRLFPASVTKVMTMLLIVEAIESGKISLDDTVTASARAASFGGSCVYLEEGERMSVSGVEEIVSFDEALDEAFRAEHGCQHSALIHSTNIHNMSRAARRMNTTIFVKNAPSYSGLGFGGEGYTTLTIATPTGEGLTSAKTFTRARRCVLKGDFRII